MECATVTCARLLLDLSFGVPSAVRHALSKPAEDFPCRLCASSLDLSEASLNSLDGLHSFAELVVRFCVLDDDFGLPVNRQDQGMTGLLEALEELRDVALEI